MRSFKLGNAGMRGVVGVGLTVERAIDFASAFGTMVDGGNVLVGFDTRSSSNMLITRLSPRSWERLPGLRRRNHAGRRLHC